MSAQRGLLVLLNRVVRADLPEKGAFGVLKEVRDHVVIWGKGIPNCERILAMVGSGIQIGNVCVSSAPKRSEQVQALNS